MSSSRLKEFFARLGAADREFDRLCTHLRQQWHPDDPPGTIIMAEYARVFATTLLERAARPTLEILDVMEDTLRVGCEEVKAVVGTGFWEVLLAMSSKSEFDFRLIAKSMGPISVEFCRKWDAFTGNQTPGLYHLN